MDTKDKNQEITGHEYMPPDSVVSPLQLDPDLTVLAENDLATALSENELKELAEKKGKTRNAPTRFTTAAETR